MCADVTPRYEVLALRFGTHADRTARDNFLMDTGQLAPVLVVDTGFSRELAVRRGRTVFRCPVDALADIGVTATEVTDVVLTHMHYDHAGNLDRFPAARVHLQQEELRFCTGPAMRHDVVRGPFEQADVQTAIRLLFDGRLTQHQGVAELLPGVTVHPVPGHTPGSQVVRVPTERGWVVLAGDAAHLWANIRQRRPFPILDGVTATLDAYDVVEALADGPDHIIPGHDPAVARRFPKLAPDSDWVCLHRPPIAATASPARHSSGERVMR
jgi:glyoxylase-like metal-dependent hydrolase (beta-lactamase superfamily II)